MKFKSAFYRIFIITFYVGVSGQSLAQTPDPASEEYQRNTGLSTINVAPAWSSTTGSGITVASLDTGVRASHFELQGRIAAGSSPGDVGALGHGTSLAGVIASNFNGAGIVGVAYQSQVLSLGIADSNRFAGAGSAAAGFNIAASNGAVRIISFGVGTIFAEPLNSSIINAVNLGKAVFLRAGNDFQSNPDVPPSVYTQFNGGGLIVGAYDPNTGTIADLSNKAGASANVYLAAPGVGITAPGNASDVSFVSWTGSSIATAHVAGAAALILSQNPSLSNQQVVEILVNSATDIDAPGVDVISGHGLLNVAAAIGAQGDLESSSSGGGALGVGLAAVAVGGGLAYFWSKNKKAKKDLENTLVFDSYDRPYVMNLNQGLSVQQTAPTLFNVMNMFDRQTRSVGVDISNNLSLTMHANTNNPTDYIFLKDSDPFLDQDDQVRDEDLAMKMAGKFNNGLSFNLQHNYAPASGFDKVGDMSLSENFIWSSSYGSQYMGFGNISDNLSVGYQANSKISFQLGANRLDDGLTNGHSSNAAMLQGSYAPTEKTSISLRVSNLYEEGSLLGGASEGAFSVSNANTTALGITGKYRIFDKFSLFGSFTEGFTNIDEQQGSFLQSFTGLRSMSWGTGIIGSNLFRYHDHAGFAISSPLRVSSGDADLVVPQSLDSSRNVVTSNTRVSLAPEGSEIDFEAFYRMNLNHRTQLGTSMTYRSTPEDADYIGEGLSVFTTVGLRF